MDLDEDGHQDLLSGSFPGQLYVFWGSDSGFGSLEILRLANTDPVHAGKGAALAVADWDGDGKQDLLVGNNRGQVSFLRNLGGRDFLRVAFAEPQTVLDQDGNSVGSDCLEVGPEIVDWDGDGDLDLLLGDASGQVQWFRSSLGNRRGVPQLERAGVLIEAVPEEIPWITLGNGEGDQFTRSGRRAKVEAADYDGDGQLDLLVGGTQFERTPDPDLNREQVVQRDGLLRAQSKVAAALDESRKGLLAQAAKQANAGEQAKHQAGSNMEARVQLLLERALLEDSDHLALEARAVEIARQLTAYQAQTHSHGWVWVYLNGAPGRGSVSGGDK